MTPQLSSDVEQFVSSDPLGAVRIEGANGSVYWVLTEDAMQIRQLVQDGIAEADGGKCEPWDTQDIIAEGRRRLADCPSN